MIDEVSLASDLFGKKRLEVLQKKPDVAIVTGVAMEDSEDGLVKVRVNGTFTLPEDEQAPSVDGNVLTLPTSPAVKEGDNLIVTMHGGQAKRPYVSDVIGSGDRQQEDINRSLTAYTDDSTYYLLSATVPATPTDETWEAAGWSTTEPVVSQEDTRTLYVSRRVELVDGTVTWSAPAKVVTSASLDVMRNAILATVSETYSTKGETAAAANVADTANDKADALNESVTELSLRAGKITASVKTMQQDYGGTVQSVNSYMTFGTDGLEVGKEDSPMKSYFNESSLSFKANGQEVMKLDGESSTVSADRWKVGGWLFYKADGGKTLVLDYFG